jgi:hypothetical protein
MDLMENAFEYNEIVSKLRHFFQQRYNFIEVPGQSRLSVLAACEDPKTISEFKLGGRQYPLMQTAQPELEFELLRNPGVPGFFSIITSYRDEPNIIEGRHKRLFPLFEFEAKGDVEDLKALEAEVLEYLGFEAPVTFAYDDLCARYETKELESEHEAIMKKQIGNSIMLEQFPLRTHPYFNMKRNAEGLFNKVDVILHGMETFGSAERSCDVEEMKDLFFATSNGEYAKLLFDRFTKERVMKEIEEYLSLPMIPRFGGGIGITRLQSAMKEANLFEDTHQYYAIPFTVGKQPVL